MPVKRAVVVAVRSHEAQNFTCRQGHRYVVGAFVIVGIGEYLDVAQKYHIIYYFMFLVTLFTIWTGIEYIIVNWKSILELFAREK